MGAPVVTAMYERASRSISPGYLACGRPSISGMWIIHQRPSRVTSIPYVAIPVSIGEGKRAMMPCYRGPRKRQEKGQAAVRFVACMLRWR
jgi:hypothetical protein